MLRYFAANHGADPAMNDPSSPLPSLGDSWLKRTILHQRHQNVDGWYVVSSHNRKCQNHLGWTLFYGNMMKHCEIINRVVVSQKESADNPGMVRSVLSHSCFSWDLNCCGSFCNVISQPQWNYGNQQMIVSLSASWQVACLRQRMLLIGSNWVIFQFSPFAAVCAACCSWNHFGEYLKLPRFLFQHIT